MDNRKKKSIPFYGKPYLEIKKNLRYIKDASYVFLSSINLTVMKNLIKLFTTYDHGGHC